MKKYDIKTKLEYLLSILSVATLILFFFPLVKITNGEQVLKLNGLRVAIGMNMGETIEQISNIRVNVQFIIFLFTLPIIGFISLLNLSSKNWIKTIILPALCLFNLVSLINVPSSILNNNGFINSNVSLTVVGYFAIVLVVACLAVSISFLASSPIKKEEKDKINIIRYIISGCLLVVLLGLLFNIVQASNNTDYVRINGIRLIFGGYLKNVAFGVSRCEIFYPSIIMFSFSLIALVLNIFSSIKANKVFDGISIILMIFVVFSIIVLPSNCLDFITATVNKSLTGFGLIMLIASLFALILMLPIYGINNSFNGLLKILATSLIVVAILSCYRITYNCHPGSSSFDNHYYSAFELMFKNVRYDGKKTYGALLFIPYGLLLLSILISFVKIKSKKMSYLISFLLIFASCALFIFLDSAIFEAISKDSQLVCNLCQNGIIAEIMLLVSCYIYLYLASQEKPVKGE